MNITVEGIVELVDQTVLLILQGDNLLLGVVTKVLREQGPANVAMSITSNKPICSDTYSSAMANNTLPETACSAFSSLLK